MSEITLTTQIGKVEHARLLVDKAREYIGARMYPAAATATKNAIEIDETNFIALLTRARQYKFMGAYYRAIKELEALLPRDISGIVLLEIGHVYMAQAESATNRNEKAKAIEYYNKAIETFAGLDEKECENAGLLESARSLTWIGTIEMSSGNSRKAAANFRQADKFLDVCDIGHLVTPSAIPFAKGQLLKAMGNYEEAYEIFDAVTRIPQINGELTAVLAEKEIGNMEYDEGIRDSLKNGGEPKYATVEDAIQSYKERKGTSTSNCMMNEYSGLIKRG